ncbi:MAG: SRPBCC family protein [Tannerella sp.]|nr:SRPBCC family protein [Tannerella sp.]
MTDFTSEIKTIPYDDKSIYSMLSDLANIERVKDRIPQEHIKNLTFNSDSCSIEVNPIGKIHLQIVNREPFKTIKFETIDSPFPLLFWIQLKPVEDNSTKMKLTARVDLNPMLKTLASKPIQDAIDKIAEMLAVLPYEGGNN